MTSRPVGILGGTFNPIHFGHLRLALEIYQNLELDHVRLIPTGTPPHRPAPRVSAYMRVKMAEIATQGNPCFQVDNREAKREGLCYTVDTLSELRAMFGTSRPLCLLMGADAFLGLCSWHNWRSLFKLAHIIVAHRPRTEFDVWEKQMDPALLQEFRQRLVADSNRTKHAASGTILLQRIALLDISSSNLRSEIRVGRSVRYLLPDAVLDYIQRNQLYRAINED